jgi:hypothetical protein
MTINTILYKIVIKLLWELPFWHVLSLQFTVHGSQFMRDHWSRLYIPVPRFPSPVSRFPSPVSRS